LCFNKASVARATVCAHPTGPSFQIVFPTNRCSEFEAKAGEVALVVGSAGTTKGMGPKPPLSPAEQGRLNSVRTGRLFCCCPASLGRTQLVLAPWFVSFGRLPGDAHSVFGHLEHDPANGFTERHDRDGYRRRSSGVIGNRAALIKHVASSRPWAGLLSMPGSLCGCAMRRGSEQSRPFGPADRRRSAREPGARRARTAAGVVFEDSGTPRKLQILIDRYSENAARMRMRRARFGGAAWVW
jgi:hypothetical protein